MWCASSPLPGTTENPVVVGYTAGDLRFWRELSARLYRSADVGKDDIAAHYSAGGLTTGPGTSKMAPNIWELQ